MPTFLLRAFSRLTRSGINHGGSALRRMCAFALEWGLRGRRGNVLAAFILLNLFSCPALAQVLYRDAAVIMGYVSINSSAQVTTANVAGYPTCFLSIGNDLSVYADNSAGKRPEFQLLRQGDTITIASTLNNARNSPNAQGKGVYVCFRDAPSPSKIITGYAANGERIAPRDTELTCALSIGNFRNLRRRAGFSSGRRTCSYDKEEGRIRVTTTEDARLDGCGYICVDAHVDGETPLFGVSYPKESSGTRSIGAGRSCAPGTNWFRSVCSNTFVTQSLYSPASGTAYTGEPTPYIRDACVYASFSYVCASFTPRIPQCSDGIDNDNDGATDLNDFSCGGTASRTDESLPEAQCQDRLDNDQDTYIDSVDPAC